MNKRMISLLLVLAMLLSAIPAVAASESAAEGPKFDTHSLILHKSISINFKVPYAYVENNFTKVEFLKDGEVVQTYAKLPEADAEGLAAFEFSELSPRELGKEVTARLYDKNGNYTEVTDSVLAYCNQVLKAGNDAKLMALVVDLLNYGAAFQTYKKDNTTPVNAGLTDAQKALATAVTDPETHKNVSPDLDNPAAVWNSATLVLEDSVTVGFWFEAESAEGWTATVDFDGKSWPIDDIEYDSGKQLYKFYFDKLTPSQLSDEMTVVIKNAEGQAVSKTLTYSVESYAYDVVNHPQAGDSLKALVEMMMCYGNAAAAIWADDSDSEETTTVLYEMDEANWPNDTANEHGFTGVSVVGSSKDAFSVEKPTDESEDYLKISGWEYAGVQVAGKQTGGFLSVEVEFKAVQGSHTITLKSGGQIVMEAATGANQELRIYTDASNYQEFEAFKGTWRRVTFVFNTEANTFEVYHNGDKLGGTFNCLSNMGEDIAFNISVRKNTMAARTFAVKNIKITEETSSDPGTTPDPEPETTTVYYEMDEANWPNATPNAYGFTGVDDNATAVLTENEYLRFTAAGGKGIKVVGNQNSKILTIEMELRWQANISLYLYSESNDPVISLETRNSEIQYVGGSPTDLSDAVAPNTWYHLKLVLDTEAGTFDLYKNHILQSENIQFRSAIGEAIALHVWMRSDATAERWVDVKNVKIYGE